MMRFLGWLIAALIAVLATVLVFLPAAWMSPLLEAQTDGRLALGDPQGSLWHGSAFIGAAPGGNEPVTPLLPGRFSWSLSPLVMLGRVDLQVENPEALSQSVRIEGSLHQWHVGPAAVGLPAERLTALGAPLNTIQPSGRMSLSWSPLEVSRQGNRLLVSGQAALELQDVASRLSPVRPLGAYRVALDSRGEQATMGLSTLRGPLMLSGAGKLVNGRIQFSGRAEAAAGQEERLANLLNLLGQRRKEGGRDYIALEFR
jgi:general secretion pathway protein N